MSLQITKKMTLVSTVALGAFLAAGCEWSGDTRDGGLTKAV